MIGASLILLAVMFVISAFFSLAETAFFSLNKMDQDFIRRNYGPLGNAVVEQIEHPRKTLTTILVGNLVANTWATAIVASESFNAGGLQASIWCTAIFGIFLTLFAEIFPKVIALRFKIPLALISAWPIGVFAWLITPIRICMRWITDQFLHWAARGKTEQSGETLSEDELKVLVQIGEEEGMLDPEERKRLHELFELSSRPVREIMTPRTDLVGLDADQDAEKHFEVISRYHFSYMPVYQNSLDQVIGIADTQAYLLGAEPRLRQVMKKPVFIPETKKISDLLADFRKSREDFAVCVDEHGGTAGVVTLEDILEEIFGEFEDEYAKPESAVQALEEGSFLVAGKISLDDFNEHFHSKLSSESETTLGGYLMEQIGEIPVKGTRFENEAFEFQVKDMQRQRIRSMIVRKKA